MSEKNVYATLRRNLLKGHDRIDRLENLVGTGMPDVNYCSEGVECWIEIKAPTYEPKRDTTALFGSNHKLSQAQKNWFLRQANAGGNAWILVATEKHWFLVDGTFADRLNEATIGYIEFWSDWNAPFPLEKKQWEIMRETLQRKWIIRP